MNQRDKALSGEELFCLQGCRSYEQYYTMRQGFEAGHCQFCHIDPTLNVVLFENEHWMAWEVPGQFKRESLEIQLVIASKGHIRYLEQLSPEAWMNFYQVIQWIEGIEGAFPSGKGGNLHVRFGDMRYNAGTVPHLHWNYWVPRRTGEVSIPVFKNPADRNENAARAEGFAMRYENGEEP